MWIARDYNGTLRLHLDKPVRMGHVWHTEPYFGSPRSIKEYHITELSNLAYIIDTLPLEIDNTLNIDGEEIDIDEYIERRTEQFFSVPDKNFEDIVGKAFINKEQNILFKVVGYNPHSPPPENSTTNSIQELEQVGNLKTLYGWMKKMLISLGSVIQVRERVRSLGDLGKRSSGGYEYRT